MASLVQNGKDGAINKRYTKSKGYCVVNYTLDAYILQEETTCERKISKAGELVFKAQYLICIK